MRGSTYYAIVDTVKLYSSPALGTPVATINKHDEAGVATGITTKTNGDWFLEVIRLSDQRKLYVLDEQVSLTPPKGSTTPSGGSSTSPTKTSTGTTTNPKSAAVLINKVQTQIKQRPVLAYTSLGLLLVGIGTLAAKLK